MKNLIFNEITQTMLLSVEKQVVDLDIVKNFALAENLLPKHEFHVAIIGSETEKVLSKINADSAAIKALAESVDWNFSLKQDFSYITKIYIDQGGEEKIESIIQTVDLSGLVEFYRKLNELTGQDFAIPFPHITLYTNSTKEENKLRGIGIYSEADFAKLSRRHLVMEWVSK